MKRVQPSKVIEGGLGDWSHWSVYFTEEEIECACSLLLLAFSDPSQRESSENNSSITNEGNVYFPNHGVLTASDVQVVNTSMVPNAGGSGLREVRPFNLNDSSRLDLNGSGTGGSGLGEVRPFNLNESPRLDMNGSPSSRPVFDLNMPPSSSSNDVILISSDDDDETDY